ncbi:lytic transglycosylase domain-containing protein [Streptomyces sp. NPDC006602]|uniref:lytic transglycosylase domain-containing protein n=1 Tax=Streptomyces sp. NPDC006602 TaxID=3364751 RepID=UPI0036D94FBA
MAALTASQAPGATQARVLAPAPRTPAAPGPSVSGDAPYRTALPPLRTREGATRARAVGAALPASVFAAYRRAETRLASEAPGCRLRWQVLAAIGQVESGQAGGGRVTADGTTVPPILGPRLDGGAFAVIRDTDGGAYDGDTVYDRAVGPMQFIPSTWARWGADGNGDGRADPGNVFDAALSAGRYLCAGGADLSVSGALDAAILGYNHSQAYLRTVRAWYTYFLEGHRVVPDGVAEASSRPEASGPATTPKPAPTPSARPTRPSTTPSGTPSPPASPTPARSRPAAGTEGAEEPLLPAPGTGVELPTDGLLPSGGPLTSES